MAALTRPWVVVALAAVAWSVAVSAQSQVERQPVPVVPGFDFSPHGPSAGQPVSFFDRSVGPDISISWHFGDTASDANNTSTLDNPTHVYLDPGSYTVTQTVSAPGRTASPPLTKPVTVSPAGIPPTARFDLLPNVATVNQVIRLQDKSLGAPTSWSWDFGDGTTGTGESPEHRYQTPNSYRVTLTVSNASGSDSHSQSVVVTPSGTQTNAEFSIPTTTSSHLTGITTGPDGALWFGVEFHIASGIGRLDPRSGAPSVFPLATYGRDPGYLYGITIAAGADGNLWFTEDNQFDSAIGRITPSGATVRWRLPSDPSAPSGAGPKGIVKGPDGNMWFVETLGNKVGKITPNGDIEEFTIPTVGSLPHQITVGPDGNLWFTESNTNKIARITPTGSISEFPLYAGANPWGIVAGPDGNLWFTEYRNSKIGRMSTEGMLIAEYPLLVTEGFASDIREIIVGPDGALWFSEMRESIVGRITMDGIVTETHVPNLYPRGLAAGSDGNIWATGSEFLAKVSPSGTLLSVVPAPRDSSMAPEVAAMTVGPDRNVWFTEYYGQKVAMVTSQGTVTEFQVPEYPTCITAGPDGALWFCESRAGKIGRITTAGSVTEYALRQPHSWPADIAAGPDGNLWVTVPSDRMISRISPAGVITAQFQVSSGAPERITVGPDRNIWFTIFPNHIGRITPGGVLTEFSTPDIYIHALDITAGPDGNVWFTEQFINRIGRITPEGMITEFLLPQADSFAYGITTGKDGNLWFTEPFANRLGRITPTGQVTEFPGLTPNSFPTPIVQGADGNLWYGEVGAANKIARFGSSTASGIGCSGDSSTLCLNGGRFRVQANWRVPSQGTSGFATAAPLTSDTGYFWFFSSNNIELVIKVVDGRSFNGNFWVFYGALSDVEYSITVTDTVTGIIKRYSNASGNLASVADTAAFAASSSGPSEVVPASATVVLPVRSLRNATAQFSTLVCSPGPTTLCLNAARFKVEVGWRVPAQGTSGAGMAVPLTVDTGEFWFFSSNNVELVVKVVDGRAFNGRYWVFYGALSDVEYTITVTDTLTGAVKTYSNPSGRLASVADTAAF